MEYILLLFLLLIMVSFIYFLFRILKWILNSRDRRIWALSLIALLGLAIGINKLFFEKMEFVQSNVYPNLYLIKHPIKDRDSIDELIKIRVMEEIEKQQFGNNNVFDIPNRNTIETIRDNDKTIHFYFYTNEWGLKNGTAYFLDHLEDPGGFTTEVLTDYTVSKIAYFALDYCKNDSTKVFGNLSYYKEGNLVKTDTLINFFQNTSNSEILKLKDNLSIKELMGLTKLEAINKYGTPSASEQFVLDDAQGEFRNGISYKYTEKERQSESILIDEVTWEKDKNTWITVWYDAKQETSVPKDAYQWKKGTEF